MSVRPSRSLLSIDLRSLERSPGAMRELDITAPAPAGLGLDVITISEASDLQVHVRLESASEGVWVTGFATARAVGSCVRCLEPVDQEVMVEVQELFAYPGTATANDDDLQQIEDDYIDLGPTLRDAFVLALPLQPVCRDDCPGLCATCGVRLADDPGHQHESTDSRWAALTSLTDLPTERDA